MIGRNIRSDAAQRRRAYAALELIEKESFHLRDYVTAKFIATGKNTALGQANYELKLLKKAGLIASNPDGSFRECRSVAS